ncbi:hypothetical protein IV203_029403 [Nitzschia inconspicua]|uniref:Uncharacterized protein n=1 Tax=Nitzschia inconspicua TaxID=303405 RepID=A0A9K3Q0Q7_9STRA|nr:hypothetical protein IV203_029403 [Nitzschia inconspicua]
MPNDPWKGIPDDIKAFRDGWEDITDHGRPYEVVLESDFSDDYWAARMCGTYEHIARSITAALVVQGKDVTSANILSLKHSLRFPTLTPTPPLLLYKHSAQYRYNKAKPGLDMNTEISANVGCAARCGFEGKYVFRMLDAVMVNTWRAYQAVTDIAPWLATLDSTPSLKQLRNNLYRKGSIRQFVFDTSYESLRLIAIQKTIIRPPFFPPANTQRTLGETFFLHQYTSYCRKNSWPIKRNARERFVEDPFLQKLRLRSFVGFEHKAEPIRDVISGVTAGPDGRVRRKCVLCFVSGNKVPRESRYSGVGVSCSTTYMCRICMVPLCKFKTTDSEWKCCHAVWHERQNLKVEISRQGKQLLENRERNDNDARKRGQHAVNSYNKRRSPTKDGPQSQLDQEMEPTNQSPTEIDDTIRGENKEEDAPMSFNEFL